MSARAWAASAAVALAACAKIDYLPPNPVAPWPTRVLMHRGGGGAGDSGAPACPYPENTLPAVECGAQLLDGVEVDVQLSTSGTLWLGHNNEVLDCAGNSIGCFQDLGDGSIDAVATCTDPDSGARVQKYVRLSDVFAALSVDHPDKYVSLDIKGQYCRSLGRPEAEAMADQVDTLVRVYGMGGKVSVESEQRAFLQRIVDAGAPVATFVNALGDIDMPLSWAANLGATGISFKYGSASGMR